jgi:hypothetical protein
VEGVATRGCDVAATELLCANVGDDYDTGAAFSTSTDLLIATSTTTATQICSSCYTSCA